MLAILLEEIVIRRLPEGCCIPALCPIHCHPESIGLNETNENGTARETHSFNGENQLFRCMFLARVRHDWNYGLKPDRLYKLLILSMGPRGRVFFGANEIPALFEQFDVLRQILTTLSTDRPPPRFWPTHKLELGPRTTRWPSGDVSTSAHNASRA
jgi:hypothetical protein